MALTGLRIIELAGLAPGPFAGMVLADFGANVIRVDRIGEAPQDLLSRGKRSIAIDIKNEHGLKLIRKLLAESDVVIDPFRPGVMEKLGLGPGIFLDDHGINKRLIFARVAGFRSNSSYQDMAGHDLNYIALSGVLSMLPGHQPTFPLNLLADFAGGAMICAMGILLALVERGRSGLGQTVQCDMVSGTRYLSSFPLLHTTIQSSTFNQSRGNNLLDGGAPFYSIYKCADIGTDRYMSVACLEPQFFRAFFQIFKRHVKIPDASPLMSASLEELQSNRALWPPLRAYLQQGFQTRRMDEWTNIYLHTDACTVPILTPKEAETASGGPVPLPHPILSRTSASVPAQNITPLKPGRHTTEVLDEYGISDKECRELARNYAIAGMYGRPPYKL